MPSGGLSRAGGRAKKAQITGITKVTQITETTNETAFDRQKVRNRGCPSQRDRKPGAFCAAGSRAASFGVASCACSCATS